MQSYGNNSKFNSFFDVRYKMISQYTWPNFRGDSDKDGVRTLMDEKGFSDDVKYGYTKIFIRSPQTLFALEKVNWLLDLIYHTQLYICSHSE